MGIRKCDSRVDLFGDGLVKGEQPEAERELVLHLRRRVPSQQVDEAVDNTFSTLLAPSRTVTKEGRTENRRDSPFNDFGLRCCCCCCRLAVLGLLPVLLRLPCEFSRLGDSQHRLEGLDADILRFGFVR